MKATNSQLHLTAGDAYAVVDLGAGGRLSSLSIQDCELIWSGPNSAGDDDPLVWGCYPMVPFAGRIRNGSFTFDGTSYSLPVTAGPHAIHGYGFLNPWTAVDDSTISWKFGAPWPFAGTVTQRFSLSPDSLTITMTVTAIDRQPVLIGWHPWFVRDNSAGTLELELPADAMYERDVDGMPDQLIAPPSGPWDDCFTNLKGPPILRWGDLVVTLESELDHWVVFSEPTHAMCVEPQSGPPNEINTTPTVLDAGEQTSAEFTLRWAAH